MSNNKCITSTVAVFALAFSPAFGQSDRGAINGTVTDPSGAAVSGAVVTTPIATPAKRGR